MPGVLNEDEIGITRRGFHDFLRQQEYGVDADNLMETAGNLSLLSSTGGAGGVLDIFYSHFKLRIYENAKIAACLSDLWAATFAAPTPTVAEDDDEVEDAAGAGASGGKLFRDHEFGAFDARKAYAAVDRVCFRVPANGVEPLLMHLFLYLFLYLSV